MRLGACTSLEKVTAAFDGLDYIESTAADVTCPLNDDAAFGQRLAIIRACPVPVEAINILLPAQMKTTGPDVDQANLDAYMRLVLERAGIAGVKVIVYGAGKSRLVPEGFDHAQAGEQVVGHLARWSEIAARKGIAICLEPLNKAECNIVNTVDEATGLVRRAGDAARLLVDTYHMAKDNDPPEAIVRARGLIAHAHCAESDGRGPLGTRGEDHRPYFQALKAAGYDGRLSIEANWVDVQRQLPSALAETRLQWETA